MSRPTVSGMAYEFGEGLFLLIVGTWNLSFALPKDLPTSERIVLDSDVPTFDIALFTLMIEELPS